MELQNIIDKAVASGFDSVEVIVNSSKEATIDLFNGEVEKNFIGEVSKYTVKAILNGKKAMFSFEDENLDVDFIVSKLVQNVKAITTDEVSSIFAGSEKYPTLNKVESDYKNISASEKIDLIKSVYNKAKGYDPRLVNFPYCEYMEASNRREVLNSKGLHLVREIEYGGAILSLALIFL